MTAENARLRVKATDDDYIEIELVADESCRSLDKMGTLKRRTLRIEIRDTDEFAAAYAIIPGFMPVRVLGLSSWGWNPPEVFKKPKAVASEVER